MYILLIDLWVVNHPCIPRINCWVWFVIILLKISVSMYISDIGLYFSFAILVWFGSIPSSSVFWKSLRRIGIKSYLNIL